MIPQKSCRNLQTPTGAELVDECARKTEALIASEHRGMGDTIEAAMYRTESKFGVPFATLFSLRYRRQQLSDIRGSVLRRIDEAFAYLTHQQEAKLRREVERTERILGREAAANPVVVAARAALGPAATPNPNGAGLAPETTE